MDVGRDYRVSNIVIIQLLSINLGYRVPIAFACYRRLRGDQRITLNNSFQLFLIKCFINLPNLS